MDLKKVAVLWSSMTTPINTIQYNTGRAWRRCEDNIRMYLKEIGINMRNWVDSAQEMDYWRALVITALNLRVS